MSRQFTWKKDEKLKSRKRIDRVFREGRSFSLFPFKVFYLLQPPAVGGGPPPAPSGVGGGGPRPSGSPVQAGFGAGSRHFKKAVDRNRIKRLCREAYRLQKLPLLDLLKKKEGSLAVFFIYTGKELPDYRTVSDKIGVLLQKLMREFE